LFDVFKFEINFHRRQNLVYVLAGVFFLITFLATSTPNVTMVDGVDNLNINSPYTVMMMLGSLTIFALFGSIAFSSSTVIRDYDLGMAELFFSTPVKKRDYVFGRFFGALVFTYAIYFAGALGVLAGEFMPWLDQERIASTHLGSYFFTTWAIALPNLFIFSCIFFCIATITRSTMATYVSAVALLMLSFVIDTFTEKQTVELTSMLDPFGVTSLEEATRYWTVFEKNSSLPLFEGKLLYNRLLWMGVGIAFLMTAYFVFPFTLDKPRRSRKNKVLEDVPELLPATFKLTRVTQHFGLSTSVRQYLSQTKLEIRNILFSVPFVILLSLGIFMVVGNAMGDLGNVFGTEVYPTTGMMIRIINGAFSLSLLVVLIYYSGELMVRERNVKVDEILDAMPHSNWVMMGAKFTGILMVIVSMLLVAMFAAMGVQVFKEFYDINLIQYLQGLLFFFQFPLYLMVVLAVFFYVITRNKFIAMFMMVLYLLASLSMPAIGLENYLYRLRATSPVYSDFTGYSQNLEPYLWQTFYWAWFGGLIILATYLLWPRGVDDGLAGRLALVKQRLTPALKLALVFVSVGWFSTGSFMYYNTNVLNEFVSGKDSEALQAEYEKLYKQYEFLPRPTITRVYSEVDIYPEDREVFLQGTYELENKTGEEIREIHLSLLPGVALKRFDLPGAVLTKEDIEHGFRIFKFSDPLPPGAVLTAEFETSLLTPGFANNGHSLKVTPNGTFIDNTDFFPFLGYSGGMELSDNNKRREHDLPPIERAAKIDDESAWVRNGLGNADRVEFETIVSTSPGQIALAPGYLQKEWEKDGRKYFHYKMDGPIWNYFSFLSADYKIKKDQTSDIDIEVYYLHDYNVDTMIESTKASLAYFNENFSPYQYRQFRILEFPGYQGAFAQSFPNTIPFSEAIGFVADLRSEEEIDYVYYVTAHELAHQWWAHQVLGANVQGSTMIIESLAQYSALMVMEEKYGKETMKRFLEFELDRYLSDRGGELIEELPLFLVENQPYIHYRKGSVVLYALQDYVGADVVNESLAAFIEAYAFKGPPYPTTKHLLAEIRKRAPPKFQNVITDLFEKIVLYDLKVVDSSVRDLKDDRYEVSIDVEAHKFESDGKGREEEVPVSVWVDIGILGEEQGLIKTPEIIHLEKVEISTNTRSLTIIVDKAPVSVGIDPLHKLIDRNPSDNVADIKS
jgi:ABC-type transport system involved in multi-copper enzyme maturation permease subunit